MYRVLTLNKHLPNGKDIWNVRGEYEDKNIAVEMAKESLKLYGKEEVMLVELLEVNEGTVTTNIEPMSDEEAQAMYDRVKSEVNGK